MSSGPMPASSYAACAASAVVPGTIGSSLAAAAQRRRAQVDGCVGVLLGLVGSAHHHGGGALVGVAIHVLAQWGVDDGRAQNRVDAHRLFFSPAWGGGA